MEAWNAIFLAMGVTGFLENLIVLILVLAAKSLRKKPHVFFVLFLSFSDVLCGVTLSMNCINRALGSNLNVFYCTMEMTLMYTSFMTSLVQVLLICVERFLAVSYLSRTYCAGSKKQLYVATNWAICTVFMFVLLFTTPKSDPFEQCTTFGLFGSHYPIVLAGQCVMSFPVLAAIVGVYAITAYRLRKRLSRTPVVMVTDAQKTLTKRENSVVLKPVVYKQPSPMYDCNSGRLKDILDTDTIAKQPVTPPCDRTLRLHGMGIDKAGRAHHSQGLQNHFKGCIVIADENNLCSSLDRTGDVFERIGSKKATTLTDGGHVCNTAGHYSMLGVKKPQRVMVKPLAFPKNEMHNIETEKEKRSTERLSDNNPECQIEEHAKRVAKFAVSERPARPSEESGSSSKSVMASVRRTRMQTAFKTVSIVIMNVVVFLAPIYIINFFVIFMDMNNHVYSAFSALGCLSMLSNPVIYIWRLKEFRSSVFCGQL